MKIRAITLGFDTESIDSDKKEDLSANLKNIQELKHQFLTSGIEVQYVRLCTTPFGKNSNPSSHNKDYYHSIASFLESLVSQKLVDIYAFGAGLCDQISPLTAIQHELLDEIPNLLVEYPNLFSSVQVASVVNGINFEAVEKCASIIQKNATPDPFTNLKFAVTFNVNPNTPFFPSAFHDGGSPALSIALEAADELVNILNKNNPQEVTLERIKTQIQERFREIYDQIFKIVKPFCEKHEIRWEGIDFSPAPYPTPEKSIGKVLELLGLSHFGEAGSVFAVGYLTEALQSVDRPKIGFSGFMQPLLEDAIIAQRHSEGKVDIPKLMLYSTMCGLGLDCIPLAGNFDSKTMELLLMDLGMMSMRLKKPLTARLMPIPSKSAGEMTEFEFEFFTNSKICQLNASTPSNFNKFHEINKFYKF